MDRESVITHLQIIHTWAEFARERDLQFFTAKHLENIAQWAGDALALLKEQEAVKIDVKKINNSGRCGRCPNCLMELNEVDYPNWCGNCGQAVKWE